MPPSVDPALGLVYVGIGNAAPQFGGDVRSGNNLFTDCVVALDLKTGKVRWYKQLVHHDIWDYDLSTPLVLYETSERKPRKGVAVMRTDGYLFAFDRETGAPIYEIEERPVPQAPELHTSPTQPFPVGGDQLGPNCTPPGLMPDGFASGCYFDPLRPDMPNLAVPFMTMRFSPMAYDARQGYFYATACVAPWWVRRPENGWLRGVNEHVPTQKWHGIIAAIDSRTNKIAWQRRTPLPLCAGSGALATATGLVFNAAPDGNMYAYDGATGTPLWEFQVGINGQLGPIGPGSGSMVTYETGGRQFIAVQMNRQVWAFSLDGKLPQRKPGEAPPLQQPFTGLVAEAGTVNLGSTITQNNPDSGLNEAWHDEYGISPARVRVKRGSTLTWTNTGRAAHTVAARDGSWSTKRIEPGSQMSLTFDKPGEYTYVCKEHPWSIAQLIVD
jgi:alcohol dehydrogenase (cytochrome c)